MHFTAGAEEGMQHEWCSVWRFAPAEHNGLTCGRWHQPVVRKLAQPPVKASVRRFHIAIDALGGVLPGMLLQPAPQSALAIGALWLRFPLRPRPLARRAHATRSSGAAGPLTRTRTAIGAANCFYNGTGFNATRPDACACRRPCP